MYKSPDFRANSNGIEIYWYKLERFDVINNRRIKPNTVIDSTIYSNNSSL